MKGILFVSLGIALTISCWGSYGPVLHKGQDALNKNKLKPLICVGAAYFIVAIIVPVIILSSTGALTGDWSFRGVTFSMAAGCAGALGALGIILALSSGGKPIYVMALVFGGAPIVNALVSMVFAGMSTKDLGARFPFFLAGVILVAIGASMVVVFAPKAPAAPATTEPPAAKAPAAKTPAAKAPPAVAEKDAEKPDEEQQV